MIDKLSHLSLAIAGPGFLLHCWGLGAMMYDGSRRVAPTDIWPGVFFLGGTFLIVVGLGFGARAKGRAVWWAVVGVVPVIGFWIGGLVNHLLLDLTQPEN